MRGHSLEVIMLRTLAVSNYRSLRQFIAPLGELTLITGPNGSGKSNVYRALRLLAETARGGLIASLAREGGFASTLWAGPESFSSAVKRGEHSVQATMPTESQALRLGFRGDDFSYAIDLGLPIPSGSAFAGDPEIKTEVIWHGEQLRPASQLVERRNAVVRIRRDNGEWDLVTSQLQPFESMMDMIADPQRAAEVDADAPPAPPHGPERTRVQPASRPLAGTREADRSRREIYTDLRCIACVAAHRGAQREFRMPVN
jgi:predicted ATPase